MDLFEVGCIVFFDVVCVYLNGLFYEKIGLMKVVGVVVF